MQELSASSAIANPGAERAQTGSVKRGPLKEVSMSRAASARQRNRKHSNQSPVLTWLNFLGLGIAIACVLATIGFVLMQAHDQLLRQ